MPSREYHTAWRRKNPEKCAASAKKYQQRLKQDLFEAYGAVCACCGEDEITFLTVEHSNGDGKEHRARVGNNVYHDLKRRGFPQGEGIEVLCMNCNFARRFDNTCPHKKDKDKK